MHLPSVAFSFKPRVSKQFERSLFFSAIIFLQQRVVNAATPISRGDNSKHPVLRNFRWQSETVNRTREHKKNCGTELDCYESYMKIVIIFPEDIKYHRRLSFYSLFAVFCRLCQS